MRPRCQGSPYQDHEALGAGMDGGMDSGMGDAGAVMDMPSTAAGGHGHDGMMFMVFQTMMDTPLYAEAWTPSNQAEYAATCIFLVILAMFARALVALKTQLELRWHHSDRRLNTVMSKGAEEAMYAGEQHSQTVRPWSLKVDPLRAGLDMVIVGVGYML